MYDNACANAAGDFEFKLIDDPVELRQLPQWIETCNHHPDRAVCELVAKRVKEGFGGGVPNNKIIFHCVGKKSAAIAHDEYKVVPNTPYDDACRDAAAVFEFKMIHDDPEELRQLPQSIETCNHHPNHLVCEMVKKRVLVKAQSATDVRYAAMFNCVGDKK